jgi:hypothetical protein
MRRSVREESERGSAPFHGDRVAMAQARLTLAEATGDDSACSAPIFTPEALPESLTAFVRAACTP